MKDKKQGRLKCIRAMIPAGIIMAIISAGGTYFTLQGKMSSERRASEAAIAKLTATIRSLNRKANEAPQAGDEVLLASLSRMENALEHCIGEPAFTVLSAIKARDMEKLSGFVHPDKGVRLSAYAYVDVKEDVVLSRDQIRVLMKDPARRKWGHYDGTGDPIMLTGSEYWTKFVYDWDFVNAREIGYNRKIGFGNSLHNAFEVYPDGIVVEYYFPGTREYEGMDWKSLMLVFEKMGREWFLVGIIHDQWTI